MWQINIPKLFLRTDVFTISYPFSTTRRKSEESWKYVSFLVELNLCPYSSPNNLFNIELEILVTHQLLKKKFSSNNFRIVLHVNTHQDSTEGEARTNQSGCLSTTQTSAFHRPQKIIINFYFYNFTVSCCDEEWFKWLVY